MNPEPVEVDLAINAELVTAILTRFIRSEIRRAGFEPRRGRAVRRHRLERGHDPGRPGLGPENVLAVTMPYKTSSEATRRDSQAVIEQLGVRTRRRADHRADRRLFRPISRRCATAAGQQVRPRADDRALRSERGVRGAGRRHQQQERAALGLRHAVRRHGLGDQPGGRPLQDAALPVGRPSGRAAGRSSARPPPATSGSARPTRASWASAMPRSIGCWCCWSIAAGGGRSWSAPASPPEFVDRVATMIRRNHYKRRMPVIAKLSHRTMDRDFRYARDWGT